MSIDQRQQEAKPHLPHTGASPHSLAQRHFTRLGERPQHLKPVELERLDPSLRTLLFTDGTVTRTLEAQTLSPVSVTVVAQEPVVAGAVAARQLEVSAQASALRRRVRIGIGLPAVPVIWAESHILPNRLPDAFFSALSGSSDGIGGSLQQVRLESWREMLWFGFDQPPAWSGGEPGDRLAITRLYRVIAAERPSLLIAETFAVRETAGSYRIDRGAHTDPNSSSMSRITSASEAESRS